MATAPTLYWYQLEAGTYAPLYYSQLDTTVRQLCSENGVTAPVAPWNNQIIGTTVSAWAFQIDTAVRALCVILSVDPPTESVINLTYGQFEPAYAAELDACVRALCSAVAYSFTPEADALTGVTYRSNNITISPSTPLGSTISITGGTYTKNYDYYTSSAGTVNPGDVISLEGVASSSSSTEVNVVLTIAGLPVTWTITTQALLLDAVPGAVAAWSATRQLKASFVGTPMTTSAGNVTAVNDQIGSRNASPAGTLAVGTGTIGSSAFAKFDGIANKLTFTALALGSSDWTMAFAIGGASATTMATLIGRSATSTTGIRGTAATNFDFRSDSAGPVSYGTVVGTTLGFHSLIFTKSGTTITIYQDGQALGAPVGRTVTGNWTVDQLGCQQAATAFSAMGFGECIIWNSLLTAGQIATVTANMKNAYPNTICIDQTAGNDSNLGWNDQVPLKNITAVNTKVVRPGVGIYLKRGETWRRQPLTFTTSLQGGADGSPVIVGAYGVGANPKLIGAELAAGPWVNTTGTEYSTTVTGLSGTTCVWSEQIGVPDVIDLRPGVTYTVPDAVTILTPGTAGSLALNTYNVTGTTLTVNVGVDPTSVYNIEVGHIGGIAAGSGDWILPSAPWMAFHDIDVWFAPRDGVAADGDNSAIYGVRCFYCANDGHGGAAGDIYQEDTLSVRCGDTVRRSSGAPGDAYSTHGGTTATRIRPTAIECAKAGIDDVDDAVVTTYGFYVRGCNRNIFTANPDAGVTGGLKTFKWGTVVRTSVDGGNAVENSNIESLVLEHVTIINTGPSSGTVAVVQNATNPLTMTNCLASGFAQRLTNTGGGALTADYNLANIGSAYGSGVSAGAHDLTADPIFVNSAAEDYRLVSGSPGIGVASDGGNMGALGQT